MEWKTTTQLLPYPDALAAMAERVAAIQKGEAEELAWLVEHPPLYTLGTSAKVSDVLGRAFPTYETGRGGQVTYHGPGQRVVYIMRDLKKHAGEKGPDLRAYVQQLEQWIILTLQHFGIEGFTREGRVGVWVNTSGASFGREGGQASPLRAASSAIPPRSGGSALRPTQGATMMQSEAKIAALGVRVQKWVTSHGIALNVNPDLSHYAGIVPCGIREFGVTSMHQLGLEVGMEEVDAVLKEKFAHVFV